MGEVGETGAEDRRRLPLVECKEVDDLLINGFSSLRGAMGDELDGASRIQPHPTG